MQAMFASPSSQLNFKAIFNNFFQEKKNVLRRWFSKLLQ